jgi:hypothetical protein
MKAQRLSPKKVILALGYKTKLFCLLNKIFSNPKLVTSNKAITIVLNIIIIK